jgi:hypothetical protein
MAGNRSGWFPAVFDLHIAADDIAGFREPVMKGCQLTLVILG